MDFYSELRGRMNEVAAEQGLLDEAVGVECAPLTPEEAIGKPADQDYVILKGHERLVEVEVSGSKGQAFTPVWGEWSGTLSDVLEFDLENPFHRAIFIATTNAVCHRLHLAERTIHCRDEEPAQCGTECLAEFTNEFSPDTRITIIGYQPRIAQALATRYPVRVIDVDPDIIGKTFAEGCSVEGGDATGSALAECDLVLSTGTVLANGTVGTFIETGKPVIFYGVTVAGAAALMGLRRWCPLGH